MFDLFGGGTFENKLTLNYHSLYALHQYLIRPNNKNDLFWNNAIGIDHINDNYYTNNWAIFYRTGFEHHFYLGNLTLALNPYFQIGISPYSKKFQEGAMRPYSFGLNVQIPLVF